MLIAIKIHTQISCRGCSYFPSNTVPLKITFSTIDKLPNTSEANGRQREEQHDNQIMPMPTGEVAAPGPPSLSSSGLRVIFKVGDDLRQDQLTIQMIRVMDKLWLKENLDLKMVTFACVPTGDRQGMLEMITEAKTLREIQVGLCTIIAFLRILDQTVSVASRSLATGEESPGASAIRRSPTGSRSTTPVNSSLAAPS